MNRGSNRSREDNTQSQAWMECQCKAFRLWANHVMQDPKYHILDLPDDLEDGVSLNHLLQTLNGDAGKYPRWKTKPRFKFQKLENCGTAIRFLKRANVPLCNVTGQDIHEDMKSVETAKESMRTYLGKQVHSYGLLVDNLNTALQDGIILCALLHRKKPHAIDVSSLSPKNGLTNCANAMSGLEELGVPHILEPSDVYESTDEKATLVFLSLVIQATYALPDEGEPVPLDGGRAINRGQSPVITYGRRRSSTSPARPEMGKSSDEDGRKCKECNFANRPNTKFCRRCGGGLLPSVSSTRPRSSWRQAPGRSGKRAAGSPASRRKGSADSSGSDAAGRECPTCSYRVRATASFCTKCGYRFDGSGGADEPSTAPSSSASSSSSKPSPAQAPASPGATPSDEVEAAEEEEGQKALSTGPDDASPAAPSTVRDATQGDDSDDGANARDVNDGDDDDEDDEDDDSDSDSGSLYIPPPLLKKPTPMPDEMDKAMRTLSPNMSTHTVSSPSATRRRGTASSAPSSKDLQGNSIPSIMWRTAASRGSDPAVWMRHGDASEWRALPWTTYAKMARNVARALMAHHVEPKTRVAIMGVESQHRLVFSMGVLMSGAVPVFVYDHLSAADQAALLRGSGVSLAYVSHSDTSCSVAAMVQGEQGSALTTIVASAESSTEANDAALSWSMFVKAGVKVPPAQALERTRSIKVTDVAAIVSTSGTSGSGCRPVAVTHKQLLWSTRQACNAFEVDPSDTIMSLTPCAHVTSLLWRILVPAFSGASVYVGRGPAFVVDDMRRIQPSIVFAPPTLWARFAAIIATNLEPGMSPPDMDEDTLTKLRSFVGCDRVRVAVSGGGALQADVAAFLEAFAGLLVLNAYVCTEHSGFVALANAAEAKFGTAGRLLPGCKVEVSPEGLLQLQGSGVATGYVEGCVSEADGDDVFLADGWLCPGDLGQLDEEGYITLLGSKHDVLITQDGTCVLPHTLEHELCKHPMISHAMIVGADRPFVTAILCLDTAQVVDAAAHNGVSRSAVASSPELCGAIGTHVESVNAQQPHEHRIRRWHLADGAWSASGRQLGAMGQICRAEIEDQYHDVIEDQLYGTHAAVEHHVDASLSTHAEADDGQADGASGDASGAVEYEEAAGEAAESSEHHSAYHPDEHASVSDIQASGSAQGMKVMIAVDLSEHSRRAASWAIAHFAASCELLIVAVNEGFYEKLTQHLPPAAVAHAQAARRQDVEAVLHEIQAEAEERGMAPVTCRLVQGDARRALVAQAEAAGVNCIVMGRRGESPYALTLGSVAAYVMQQAKCAVLTL